MNYTLVYRESEDGYNWSVLNSLGMYAAWIGHKTGNTHVRRWNCSKLASEYMDKRSATDGALVWAPWPTEKATPIKPVTTAATYKLAHGCYPQPVSSKAYTLAGTYTGRFRSSDNHISEQQRPLVWPVIPQADDGSNEEATTVPDSLVQLMSQRVFIVRLYNALTK